EARSGVAGREIVADYSAARVAAIRDDRTNKHAEIWAARTPSISAQLHAAGNPRGRPVFQLGAERETLGAEHVLDFGERLLAEVRGLQQLDLGLLDQIADVVDAFGLEAVGRTHGEFEIVDRAQQQRRDPGLVLLGLGGFAALEVAEYRQLLVQRLRGLAHGLVHRHGAVGFDVQHQLVEVGALLDARGIDGIRHATHRAERRIDLQAADRAGFLVRIRAADRRLVTDAAARLQPDVQRDTLEVQQHLDHVFLQTFERGVFVQNAFDFGLDDGRAGNRRQQHAAQRIAERMTVAAFQRLDDDARVIRSDGFDFQTTRTQDLSGRDCHGLLRKITGGAAQDSGSDNQHRTALPSGSRRWRRRKPQGPAALATTRYFEYNSTISASLMSLGSSARSGMALNTPAAFFASTSIQPGRRSMLSETFSASCTRNCFCARSVSLISSPGRSDSDGTLAFLPLTMMDLCATSWRACARVTAKPMRYTTLSRRASRMRNRSSPVLPFSWVAFL